MIILEYLIIYEFYIFLYILLNENNFICARNAQTNIII